MSPGVPPTDRGFLYGDGVFETVLLVAGRPFRLERHIERLREGLERIGIPFDRSLDDRVRARVREALESSFGGRDQGWDQEGAGSPRHALRIVVTSGDGPIRGGPDRPRCLVTTTPVGGEGGATPGLTALLTFSIRVDPDAPHAGVKTLAYLDAVLALREARGSGADDAILPSLRGNFVRGATSNLFVVRGETLLTPGPGDGARPGVTREAVIEIAGETGFTIEEIAPAETELLGADEVFLTSSLRGIAPVAQVRRGLTDHPIGEGGLGPVTRRIAEAYARLVAEETGAAGPVASARPRRP